MSADLSKGFEELFQNHGELIRLAGEFPMLRTEWLEHGHHNGNAITAMNQRMIDISIRAVADSTEAQTAEVLSCCLRQWAKAHSSPFYVNGDSWPRDFTELVLIAALNLKKREKNTSEASVGPNSVSDVLIGDLREHFDTCLRFIGKI